MTTVNAKLARQNLCQLIAYVNDHSEPIAIIDGKGKSAILVSEDDWKYIQATLCMNNVPSLSDSVIEGGYEPLSECKPYFEDEEW